MSAFLQPPIPGYSPWPGARQDSPFLHTPGVQGLQEGVGGGQGQAFSPQQEFFSGGTEGTAPPSSVAPGNMWARFGGGGEAPSSLTQPQAGVQPQDMQTGQGNMQQQAGFMQPAQGNMQPGFANADSLATLLRGPSNAVAGG